MGRVEMARHSCGTPPLLEDIAGAKHWDNMPDQGFTAHRSSVYKDGRIQTEAVMLHRKTRFEQLWFAATDSSAPANASGWQSDVTEALTSWSAGSARKPWQ
jgi:hypothetical protein